MFAGKCAIPTSEKCPYCAITVGQTAPGSKNSWVMLRCGHHMHASCIGACKFKCPRCMAPIHSNELVFCLSFLKPSELSQTANHRHQLASQTYRQTGMEKVAAAMRVLDAHKHLVMDGVIWDLREILAAQIKTISFEDRVVTRYQIINQNLVDGRDEFCSDNHRGQSWLNKIAETVSHMQTLDAGGYEPGTAPGFPHAGGGVKARARKPASPSRISRKPTRKRTVKT